MAINQYFRSNFNGNAEQKLIEDLLIESIKIYGMDMEYIPYTHVNEDGIYGEDQLLEYNKAYTTEMYIETVQGFESEDLLSKFGLQKDEKANLMVSMRRFQQCTEYTLVRPREKDLIYFPLTDSLYEITFVKHDSIFHQVGALQVYSLRINLFNYAHQKIRTGVREIDKFENQKVFILEFQLEQTGISRYLLGEDVYQGTDLAHSTAKGNVVWFDRHDKILKIKDIVGDFDPALPIKGVTSNAEFAIASFDTKTLSHEPIADNKQVKDEGQGIIDWSERNPFGEPS